jgi:NAD(P)-dependent dehydrogenase (short-subunit alcohol dehydrogenase family)
MTTSILDRQFINEDSHSDEPKTILIAGASGGIGQAFCQKCASLFPKATLIRLTRNINELIPLNNETLDISFELTDEASIIQATQKLPDKINIDWIFVATGWLHDSSMQPEKTYKSLDPEHLAHAFSVNAIGPSLLLKQLFKRINQKHPGKIGLLSARVGSISDNRLGGWYAYRSSKAALNMLIKNFSIEFERMRKPFIIVGLQPGTTDTPLSAPFQRGVAANKLQTPEYTASQLIKVMQALKEENSGNLYDFQGFAFAP